MPAMTLPAKYYTDPENFRAEMERFYFGRWIYAGRAERIEKPGSYFLCDVAGESIIVTREGAYYNVCRHRGTRMCKEPEGNFAGRIQCPYHGWTYALDGSLIAAPNMGEGGFSRFDYPLHKVGCEIWDGHVFLNLADKPAPLVAQLGELPDKFAAWKMGELRFLKRIVYDVKANWKLIIQNYNE
jgi:Rieske 2Fe-2S family protein